MRISVIVATYNRAALLDECLTHVASQGLATGPNGDEVIVVDNGSTDSTPMVLVRHRQHFPVPLICLREAKPGKSNALAAGVAASSGEILAFTDDDVNVSERWIEAIRCAFERGAAALIGGPVTPRWEHPAPFWLRRSAAVYGRLASPLALLDYGPDTAPLGPRTLLGANMAVRREALEKVGGFAPHLGKLRGTLLSGEDHEFCRKVEAAGFLAQYRPDMPVEHWVPAERMRVGYVLKWFYWSGITNAALDETDRPCREVAGVPLYLVRRFLYGAVAALAAAISGRTDRAVEQAIDCAFAAGYATKRLGFDHRRPAAAAEGLIV